MNESTSSCVDRLDEIVERVLSLEETSPGDGKEPGGEEFAIVGLIPEADLSPLNRGANPAFGCIVGRLDSVMLQKREQAIPVLEQAASHPSHIRVRGEFVRLEAVAHAGTERNGFQDKGLPIQMLTPECMEQSEHPADLREHPAGEFHSVRTAARMADSFDLSDDVSPTDLPQSLVVASVGREAV
jgi:hypothetical protein